jgi:hypothetical protein
VLTSDQRTHVSASLLLYSLLLLSHHHALHTHTYAQMRDAGVTGSLEVAAAVAAERMHEFAQGVAVAPHPGNRIDGAPAQEEPFVPYTVTPQYGDGGGGYVCADYTSVYAAGAAAYTSVSGEYKTADYDTQDYVSVYDVKK